MPKANTAIKKVGKTTFSKTSTVLPFLMPALIIYGVYNVYGIIMTFYYSTLNWSGIGLASKAPSVGLGNYVKIMIDSRFWHSLSNNLLLVVVSIFVQLGLGMVLALIINSKIKGAKLFRTVYFMPMLLSTVATGILWQLIYDPYSGLINTFLKGTFNMSKLPVWLGSEKTVMFSVMFVICWQYTPQYMILLRAGMTNIGEEIYEAATIDGANKWQQFFSMTLPLLSGTLKTSAVLSIVGSLKYFDLIYVMTGGGPNGYSELMATYMYKKAFSEDAMSYASAIAACMFFISLIVVIIFQYMTKSKEES